MLRKHQISLELSFPYVFFFPPNHSLSLPFVDSFISIQWVCQCSLSSFFGLGNIQTQTRHYLAVLSMFHISSSFYGWMKQKKAHFTPFSHKSVGYTNIRKTCIWYHVTSQLYNASGPYWIAYELVTYPICCTHLCECVCYDSLKTILVCSFHLVKMKNNTFALHMHAIQHPRHRITHTLSPQKQ